MRMILLMAACAWGGCDDWTIDDDATSGSPGQPAVPREAGVRCTALPALRNDASSALDGAFCFGVAAGASEYLGCSVIDADDIACADEALGTGYLVRGTSGTARVVDLDGVTTRATITQRSTGSFEISTAQGPAGVCTIRTDGIRRAEFCAFD